MKRLVIFGGSTAAEILPIAREQHGDGFAEIITHFFNPEIDNQSEFSRLATNGAQVFFIAGVVDAGLRQRIFREAVEAGFEPFTVIHRSADVAESAKIEPGCFVAQQAVVSINVHIGASSIIHIHSSIGHDSSLGSGCTILPGARISGRVKLAEGVFVGSNAFVAQNTKIGQHSTIDAMTYVSHNVDENMLVSCRLDRPIRQGDHRNTEPSESGQQ